LSVPSSAALERLVHRLLARARLLTSDVSLGWRARQSRPELVDLTAQKRQVLDLQIGRFLLAPDFVERPPELAEIGPGLVRRALPVEL